MAIREVRKERRGYTIYTDDGKKRTRTTPAELLGYCASYFLVRQNNDYVTYDEELNPLRRFSCNRGEFVEMLPVEELFVLKHPWYGYVAYDIDLDKVMTRSELGDWKETNEGKQKRQHKEREERKRREWEEERKRREWEEERKRKEWEEERERKEREERKRREWEEERKRKEWEEERERKEREERKRKEWGKERKREEWEEERKPEKRKEERKRMSSPERAPLKTEISSGSAEEAPAPEPEVVPAAPVHMTAAPGSKNAEVSQESPEPPRQAVPRAGTAHNPCRTYSCEKPRFLDGMKDAICDAVRRVWEFVCGLGLPGVVVICFVGGLGYLCISGVERDGQKKEKATQQQAAEEAMDAEAQFQKGLEGDDGLPEHAEFLKKWYGYAAAKGHAAATYKYGTVVYRYEGQADEAVPWFRKAAELGFADAQYKLAECYRLGKGVEKDAMEAFKWYMEAAKQGQMDAQYRLGECYDKGFGVTADAQEALRWYSSAADQGDGVAMVSAAYILMKDNRREAAMQMLRRAEQSKWIEDMRTEVLGVGNGQSPLYLDSVNLNRRDSFGDPW